MADKKTRHWFMLHESGEIRSLGQIEDAPEGSENDFAPFEVAEERAKGEGIWLLDENTAREWHAALDKHLNGAQAHG